MKRFILSYFLSLALLFGLLYAPIWSVSNLLNEAQTNLTLFLLNLFLEPHQLQGSTIAIKKGYVIYITKNGDGHADFYWSHDFVGNVLLMMSGLLFFIGFIKRGSKW